MNIDNRKTKTIILHKHMYTLVKLTQSQLDERRRCDLPKPSFMGYKGWALHSCVTNPRTF
jgi:uncharacterized protein YfbU (UPF0304 family)